jgi:dienelactone hydrolase
MTLQSSIRRRSVLSPLALLCTLLCSVWLCAGCEEAPLATEVLVVIDGDADLASQLSRLEVRVYNGTSLDTPVQPLQIGLGSGGDQRRLPVSFSIAPAKQDDARAFRVLVTGFDPQSRVLVEQQVLTSFHPNYAGRLDVHLYGGCANACREQGKPGTLTCSENGSCEPIPQRNELPAATAGDLGGYTVVMAVPAQDGGGSVPLPEGDARVTTDAGGQGGSVTSNDAAVGTAPDAAVAAPPDAEVPSVTSSDGGSADTGTIAPTDAAADAQADAAADASVDAARDATVDASVDASNPDAGKFAANPVIPALPASCPVFQSGNITALGMTLRVWAGSPVATKGPLLFYWHGTGSSSAEAGGTLPQSVRDDISSAGGLIVAPASTVTTNGTNTSGNGVWFAEDNAVIDVLVACAVRDHNIDPRRIYTTGASAGGLHAGSMAFQRAAYIAAVSANSGGLAAASFATLQAGAARPAPALTMHGGAEDVVIVSFATTSSTLYNNLKSRSVLAVNCDHGGRHVGATPALQEAAWQFMKDHPFGVTPEPYAAGLPASFPSYCSIK